MAERCGYREAIRRSGVLEALRDFDPHIAGTPPLGLDLPTSDIDILCHATDPDALLTSLWRAFSHRPEFRVWQWRSAGRPIIASFNAEGWSFEVFGSAVPVEQQLGWRHYQIERRLLELGGRPFREAIMARRRLGAKTEPAFWDVLGGLGDPYAGMARLADLDDADLKRWLKQGGFQPNHLG